nr:alpha/beta hydrolases superfamily protein [Tanacetum cinerariifolium]
MDGAKVKVPVKFIVGDLDLTYNALMAKDHIEKAAATVTGSVMVETTITSAAEQYEIT